MINVIDPPRAEPRRIRPRRITPPAPEPRRHAARSMVVVWLAVAAIPITASAYGSAVARADPPAEDWAQLRQCESSGRYDAVADNGHYGAYQFDLATWRSVGGTGLPSTAAPAEQDHRALALYRSRGWQPWECATILGLTDDPDARTGRLPTSAEASSLAPTPRVPRPAPTPAPTSARVGPPDTDRSPPPWPGALGPGACDPRLRAWQLQMNTYGYDFDGTGCYGDATTRAVAALQHANHLPETPPITEATWRAAWTGTSPTGAPRWPGRVYVVGDCDSALIGWQLQMATFGYPFRGTGCYGDITRQATLDLQRANNLDPTGRLGPQTWLAAWAGAAPDRSAPSTPAPVPPSAAPTPAPAPTVPGGTTADGVRAAVVHGWGPVVAGDEFGYTGSPDPGRWGTYDGPGHAGNGLRRPSAFRVGDGVLTVTGDEAGTTGGMAARFANQRYGRWETRMRVPAGDSQYHPVLILWPDSENFPCDGEVDYAETTTASTEIDFFLHYSCSNRQVSETRPLDLTEWHNYAVEWTAGCITGFIDGTEWFRDCDPAHVPKTSMHQTVQLDYFPDGGDRPIPSTMQVAWVRVYDM